MPFTNKYHAIARDESGGERAQIYTKVQESQSTRKRNKQEIIPFN